MSGLTFDLEKLNQTYHMFNDMAAETVPGEDESIFQFSAKDNLCTKDLQARAGSRILEGYRPPFDATAVARLRSAGGVLLGKTNMDEFGFGTFGTNSGYQVPLNPFDLKRACGGSSAGAACAASVIPGHLALGVSTGGSISCPASFCGVFGLTPTYGRVSRYGLIDYGNSLDKIGLLTMDVGHLRRFLPIISGADPRDPTSCAQPPLELDAEVRRVVIPEDSLNGVDGDVLETFQTAIEHLSHMGIEVTTMPMPALRFALPAYYVLATSEASTNLARYCGMRYGERNEDYNQHFDPYFSKTRSRYLGQEAKRRVLLGTFTRMVGFRDRYYMKALATRELVISEYAQAFEEHDLVLTPTMPFLPPLFADIEGMSPLDTYKADGLTVPPNLAGLPHLSAPCGYVDGVPVGMQFVSPHWTEGRLVTMAESWNGAHPPMRPEVIL